MNFTRKEGSDDTRDVVAQRAVGLPYMTQDRQVAGGTLTTSKAFDGVSGSLTRVVFAADEEDEPGEAFYAFECQRSLTRATDRSRTNTELQHLGVSQVTTKRVQEFIKIGDKPSMLTFQQGTTDRALLSEFSGSSVRDTHYFTQYRGVHVAPNFCVNPYAFKAITADVAGYLGLNGRRTSVLVDLSIFKLSPYASKTVQATQARGIMPGGAVNNYTPVPILNGYISGYFSSMVKGYTSGSKVIFGYTSVSRVGDMVSMTGNTSRATFTKVTSSSGSVTSTNHVIYNGPAGSSQWSAKVTMVSRTNYFAIVFPAFQIAGGATDSSASFDVIREEPRCFWSSDAGVTWAQRAMPLWDFSNYGVYNLRPEDKFFTGNSSADYVDTYELFRQFYIPGSISRNTHSVPMSKDKVFMATLVYKASNSASGGQFVMATLAGSSFVNLGVVPIPAYQFSLVNICRPKKAIVMTFIANADLRVGNYPGVIGAPVGGVITDDGTLGGTPIFDGVDISQGYAARTKIGVYKQKPDNTWELILRDLPWPRTHAFGHVFCATNDLLGTIVRAFSTKHNRDVFWLYTSKDLGVTWKKSAMVDHLSDMPTDVFWNNVDGNGSVTSLVPPMYMCYSLVNGFRKEFSYPPLNMLGSTDNGIATVPHPGAPWLYT